MEMQCGVSVCAVYSIQCNIVFILTLIAVFSSEKKVKTQWIRATITSDRSVLLPYTL